MDDNDYELDQIVDECRCEMQGRCNTCGGTGMVIKTVRVPRQKPCSKPEKKDVASEQN